MLLTADILAQLRQGAILLTANQQLANRLRLFYQQQQQDCTVWPTPLIFHLEDWLRESFFRHQEARAASDLPSDPAAKKRGRPKKSAGKQLALFSDQSFFTLLTTAQSLALWEQIIENWKKAQLATDPELALLQVESTAAAAYQTYRFCCQEELTFDEVSHDPEHRNAPDHLKFLLWWQTFSDELRKNAWLDAALLPNFLQKADWPVLWPKKNRNIIFYDFDIIPKNLENLQKLLQESGYQLHSGNSPKTPNSQFFYAPCADAEAELQQVALWVKQQLAAGKKNIGIISRDVPALRPRLTPYLLSTLQPDALAHCDAAAPMFRFNIGLPLSDFPLVHNALKAFSLLLSEERLPLPAFGDWLRSPFFPWWSERELLEKYRLALYQKENPEILLEDLPRLVESTDAKASADSATTVPLPVEAKIFQAKWQIFLQMRKILPEKAQWSVWLKYLRSFWQALGLGKGRTLSSSEFQCQVRLLQALDELMALENIWQEPLTFVDFQEKLQKQLQAMLFQPQGRGEAAVQILGVLEAESQRFTALWLLDAQARHWPAAARPLPFLRQELQGKRPESTAHGQLAKAERLLQSLLQAAPLGVVSFAVQGSEGQVQAASQLLPPLPVLPDLPPWQHPWLQRLELPIFHEHSAASAEKITATVLEHQASCPFRGYVSAQLPNLRPFPELLPFLSSRERGNILHEILEKFFQQHPNAAPLASYASALNNTLPQLIDHVFAKAQKKRPQALAEPYFSVEKHLAQRLLTALVQADIPSIFKNLEVKLREHPNAVTFGALTVTSRLDRLDVFDSADQTPAYVLWDYKTGGSVNLKADLSYEKDGEAVRLKKPQLALYALNSSKTPLRYVGYIHLHPNVLQKVSQKEKAAKTDLKNSEKSNFYHFDAVTSEKSQAWQAAIDTFIQEIQSGNASIQPQKEACQYCDYSALCRHPDLEKSS